MAKKKQREQRKQLRKALIEALVIAALNVLDIRDLSDKQRNIADQIYGLCNELEETI